MTSDLWLAAADLLDPPPNPYLQDPAGWVHDTTGEHLWSKQVEVANAVRDHRRVAVPSCHDSGKSFGVGRIAGWWIDTHPPGEGLILTTAPTFAQVRGVTWHEIRRTHSRARLHAQRNLGRTRTNEVEVERPDGLPGRCNQTEWWIGDELVGLGRKPGDHDVGAFQGFHRRYILVIIDEASGLPESLWEDIERVLTNEDAKVLAIGNPDYQGSPWHQVCEDKAWHTIHIDGLETPNFTDEAVPAEVAKVLLSKTWVGETLERFGEDSPQYQSMVRGMFPADAADTIVPWSWAQRCTGEQHTLGVGELRVPVELGVDVGEGGDETVVHERTGPVSGRWWRTRSGDSEDIVDLVIAAANTTKASSIKVDAIGLGFGVIGSLRRRAVAEIRQRVEIHGVKVSEEAEAHVLWLPDGERGKDGRTWFVNLRAQLWWMARELSRQGDWDLTHHASQGGEPERGCSTETMRQLTTPKYFTHETTVGSSSAGRIQVEKKTEAKARLGRSPDDADALLLAFYEPSVERQLGRQRYQRRGRRRR